MVLALPGHDPNDVVVPAAKTRRPRRSVSAVQRHRLLELWCRSDEDVTLVLAPPGFGKTTFVSQLADVAQVPVVWASVEPTDDDPVVLISTLLAALRRAGVDVVPPAGALTGDEPAFTRRVLPVFRQCLEQLSTAVVLVVDDVHSVDSVAAAAVLTAVVDSLPPGSRVVLVGRARPELPVARWRSEARLLEVGAEELRFGPAETRACLSGILGRGPSTEELSLVQATSEGWPVAVYLEGTAVSRSGAGTQSPSHGLEEYLRAEVLGSIEDDLAEFLSRTSVLASLSGPACDHVLDRTGSAEQLRRMEAATLLVTRLEGPGGWYRVHPLLREALAARLTEESPAEVGCLHARAARWYAAQGQSEEAIRHAIATGDAELVQEVGWHYGIETLMNGRTAAIRSWLERVPDADVEAKAGLAILAAWAGIASGDSSVVQRWAVAADRALGPDWADDLTRTPYAPVMALLVCLSGALPHADGAVLAGAAADTLPVSDRTRCLALLLHGWLLALAGDPDAGLVVLEDARAHAQSLQVGTMIVQAPALMGYLHHARGDLAAAREMSAVAVRAWTDHDMRDAAPPTGITFALDAYLHVRQRPAARTRADLARTVRVGQALARAMPVPAALVSAYVARTWAVLGDQEQAHAELDRATEIEHRLPTSAWLSGVIEEARDEVERLGPTAALSEAQRRVLAELATDKTMGEIAADLHLSINTVKSHARDIYRKLGISTRREARRVVGG